MTGREEGNKGFLIPTKIQTHRWDVHHHNIGSMTQDILIERQQWLDIPHACQVADVSSSTMRLLIKAGVLRACQLKVPGKAWGKWIVNRQSLLSFLDKLAAAQQRQGHDTTRGEVES